MKVCTAVYCGDRLLLSNNMALATTDIIGHERLELAVARSVVKVFNFYVPASAISYAGFEDGTMYFTAKISEHQKSLYQLETANFNWVRNYATLQNPHETTASFMNFFLKDGNLKRDRRPCRESTFRHTLTPNQKRVNVVASFQGFSVGEFTWTPKDRFLTNLIVNPIFNGLGLARKLLDYTTATFGTPVTLQPQAATSGSLNQKELEGFYSRYGFRPKGKESLTWTLTAESQADARLESYARLRK